MSDIIYPSGYVNPVPQQLTMCQAKLALLAAGLLPAVNATVAGLSGPTATVAQIEWEYETVVRRNSALIASLAPAMGLTDAQLDALFIAGALL